MSFDVNELWSSISRCMLVDQYRLQRGLQRVREIPKGLKRDEALLKIAVAIDQSMATRAQRLQRLPQPTYPQDLPVVARRQEIADAIVAHQVVIVCGETGSGKTTQLPKICLELGRGVGGMIGHTQPRRIAARSVAQRLAQELSTDVGHAVGYKVRFSDRVSPDSYIKLMTDGILLAETQSDRFLNGYDTLIVDEAHERSINVDFLLGYMKRLLPRRPELKLIITSATIDSARFAAHFGGAPVINVVGRSHPVEVRYRPVNGAGDLQKDRDLYQAILDAVDELAQHGQGDMLVFLPGEREIRTAGEALRKHHPPHTEILPLFSRLSVADQNKVFKPPLGRRIVLTTNVAETSLTVPGIRYVIDSGLVRIKRMGRRNKIQRLPIEPVSQSSANQRAGRCGRVGPGVCIRLFEEQDFVQRPMFTEPEILRMNLAGVILQMKALGLGDVDDFPFIDVPNPRQIGEGYKLLEELGAVDRTRKVTRTGTALARFPVDPRIARMVMAAQDYDCLSEVIVIASALSIQDPRERPLDAQQAADQAHERFRDERSDFLFYLRLWQEFEEQSRHLSQNKLRSYCRSNFLAYMRMLEWRDVHGQLANHIKDSGWHPNTEPAEYESIHRALLTGLIGNVGFNHEPGGYLGLHNIKFQIFPGSALFKKQPKWIVAAELVDTSRAYARTVARIDLQWVESAAKHLLSRTYFEPHWERKRAQVGAFEKVTLGGLTIVQKRRVNYGPINPVEAREIFIRSALVQGAWDSKAAFFEHNLGLVAEVVDLEHKSRRHDILVSEQDLFEFYAGRIPDGVYSGADFEKWRAQAEAQNPHTLYFSKADTMRRNAADISAHSYPDSLDMHGTRLPLTYQFEPGAADDGVTVHVPLSLLNQIDATLLEWLIPGLLEEKIIYLLKSLPKPLRRNFVPVPDYAKACLQALSPYEGEFLTALVRELKRITGISMAATDFTNVSLPDHLLMRIHVRDDDGQELASGRDLLVLQQQWGLRAKQAFNAIAGRSYEQQRLTEWPDIDLAKPIELVRGNVKTWGYPALIDRSDSVDLCILDDKDAAQQHNESGQIRLYLLHWQDQAKYLRRHLPSLGEIALLSAGLPLGPWPDRQPDGSNNNDPASVANEIIATTVRRLCVDDQPSVVSRTEFYARAQLRKAELIPTANELAQQVLKLLRDHSELQKLIAGRIPLNMTSVAADIKLQLRYLVYRGFIANTPSQWWCRLPRYLQAARLRWQRAAADPVRDRTRQAQIATLFENCLVRLEKTAVSQRHRGDLMQLRWLLEEFRISLFAQELKTNQPVSAERLAKVWAALQPG